LTSYGGCADDPSVTHSGCCTVGTISEKLAPRWSRNYHSVFTPAYFIASVERERRWLELLMTAMFTRSELHNLDPKLADGNAVNTVSRTADYALRN
jgi:hypothetical protein